MRPSGLLAAFLGVRADSAPASTAGARPLPVAALLLAALLLLGLATAPPAGAGTIARAKLDGTGVDPAFITTTAPFPGSVAVDGAHIYWDSGGAIARANLDGTAVNESFIATEEYGVGMAADGAHIYWSSRSFTDASIGRANLDGSGVNQNFITGFSHWGMPDVAVDDTHIYWTNSVIAGYGVFESRIGRANLDGSGVDQGFISGLFDYGWVNPVAVAGAYIYWGSSRDDLGDAGDAIGRANLDGSGVDPSFISAASIHGSPYEVAVDGAHIYWSGSTRVLVGQGWSHRYDGIGRANLDGSGVDPRFITPPVRCPERGPAGLAVDGAYVYWSSHWEPPPPGWGRFRLGKVKQDARKGTARLAVRVPGEGRLLLARTGGVWGVRKRVRERGWVWLPIRPGYVARQQLATRGRATVKLRITFNGWDERRSVPIGCPQTRSRKLTLIRRG